MAYKTNNNISELASPPAALKSRLTGYDDKGHDDIRLFADLSNIPRSTSLWTGQEENCHPGSEAKEEAASLTPSPRKRQPGPARQLQKIQARQAKKDSKVAASVCLVWG